MPSLPRRVTETLRARGVARGWLIPAALVPWFALGYLRQLENPFHQTILGGMNLAFHEMGHIVAMYLPRFWMTAAGTVMELAIPIVAGIIFYRRKEDAGVAFSLFWLGTALAGVAIYMGDARLQALPLVSPFPGPAGHDWAFLLGEMGLLEHDHALARGVRRVGLVAMLLSVILVGWLAIALVTSPSRKRGLLDGAVGSAPLVRTRPPSGKKGADPRSLRSEEARLRSFLAAAGALPAEPESAPEEMEPGVPSPDPVSPDSPAALLRRKADSEGLSHEERRFLEFLEGSSDSP